ncbi:cysteinyl-tRNA synthetase [Candidatus Uzinura diaspidicola str. ASNER]|uniref:Cysteine--tRNA ligase n=1 Tax=Candidatus Uzinura diaspidicola str. ASNER TaxID=1133592 RepID=L7VN75_9FLAO|nr:cysteinyl-tRNA synthetase [Candidatus Uzinura diaspidicola str. ASNER]
MHKITTKETFKIYNTLSRKKEVFMPIISGHVGMYVCGATVYNDVHLGNCRTFISLDLIVRYFRYLGYKVRYVRNITDVGHLEDETNDSYDKITKKALIERIEPMELAQKYTYYLHSILDKFNALSPNIEPSASGHIIEQIEIIKMLIKKGFAYEIDGSVYLDLNTYIYRYKYGILSRSNIEKTLEGNSRCLKNRRQKRNTKDFSLWKKADDAHIMQWMSPWGRGFPGWHLECTTMSLKYLGDVFDVHAGGIDLKFPHHDCEIAQSISLHGKIPVHYWIHTNLLTLNGEKMSKSIGNTIFPFDILTKFSSDVIRFFILQTHYRKILDFSSKALVSAKIGYNRLIESFLTLEVIFRRNIKVSTSTLNIITWKQKCYDAMNDDFNSPRLIAHLFEAMHCIHSLLEGDEYLTYYDLKLLENTMKSFFLEVLGLKIKIKKQTSKVEELLKFLIEIRSKARKEKNWVISDNIRKDLFKIGYNLLDNENETKVEVI